MVWVDHLRVVRPDQPPQLVRETWVTADLDDGAWTIGYRVETIAGAPLIAEQRTWQTSNPPWAPLPLVTEAPRTPLSLDRAHRRLSEKRALEAWRDHNESIDAGGGALQPVARWYGFDPHAPLRARPDDDYYVDVAVKYVKHKRLAPASPHVGLALELGITQDQSRK